VEKLKIALYWCSSCGGCEESVLDLADDLLGIAESVDILFWPVAIDMKYHDVEMIPDGGIAATLINGAIRMGNQERIAGILRKKSKLIIAHGSCAHTGGIVGLANFYNSRDILNRAFIEVPSANNPQRILPGDETKECQPELRLPHFYNTVKALDQVVEVDYYIPGCPPTPSLIKNALGAILQQELPSKGSVLAEKKALCYFCSRKESKPDIVRIKRFKRLYEKEWDSTRCFLDQELICLGPATRGGCGERCIKANMPCRGCFGPPDNVTDQGAKILSFLASFFESPNEKELKKLFGSIPDPAGLFYRYSLASSILKGTITKQDQDNEETNLN
jgi:F420-non-reducing hydrogenase small subunit